MERAEEESSFSALLSRNLLMRGECIVNKENLQFSISRYFSESQEGNINVMCHALIIAFVEER